MIWLFAVAICLCSAVMDVHAADDSGLVVEKVQLREILRTYTTDPAGFDTDNGAQALAALFTETVGLNYYGEGNPASYFAKDITGKYESDPYIPANLVGTYEVPIHPVNGRAEATTGQTWKIYTYLTGYNAEAEGAVPVYHYVWQDNGSWWAVRDDVPYYKVSYNGMSAAAAESYGVQLVWARSGDVGAVSTGSYTALKDESVAAVANGSGVTYVAVAGQAAIFAAQDSAGKFITIGDYVAGSFVCGPVLRSHTVSRADGSVLGAGEKMIPGENYRVSLVYREGLKRVGKTTASVTVLCADGDPCAVNDVAWYGADEYLTRHDYNPHVVEFTVTAGNGCDWCSIRVDNVVGFESGKAPAVLWHSLNSAAAAPAAPVQPVITPAPTAEPVMEVVAAIPAPTAEPTAAPTVEPTAEPTPEPTMEPTPDPVPAVTADSLVTWNALALRLWEQQGKVDVVNDPSQSEQYLASCWAASVGLTENWANGGMTGETALTREQMACVLYAYTALIGQDVSASADLAGRPDGANVSPWAVTAVQWAVGSGVLTPAMDGSIAPGATVSHGQLDWMLSVICK